MSKINFTYLSKRVKYGIGMSLMACVLTSCSNNVSEKSSQSVVNEVDDAIKISCGTAYMMKDLNFSESELEEIQKKIGNDKVVIDVYDESDYISGVELIAKDLDGNIIDNFVTTNDFYILDGVEPGGTYIIEEKSVPEDYDLEERNYKFTVPVINYEEFPEDKYYAYIWTSICKQSKTFEESKYFGSFDVTCFSREEGDEISGAIFEVCDMNGELIEIFTSTERTHTVTNLKDGQYKVRILELPDGYEIDEVVGILEENSKLSKNNEYIVTIKDGQYPSKSYSGPIFYVTKTLVKTSDNYKVLIKNK